jgi:hypothetical protein
MAWKHMGTVLLSAALIAGPAWADDDHLHEGDFEVEIEHGHLHVSPGVLEGEFANVGGFFITDDPGFDTDTGAFTPGTRIGFNILEVLGKWNGNGFDPAAEFIEINAVDDQVFKQAFTSAGFVAGFDLPVNSEGEWHKHLNFILHGPGSDPFNPLNYVTPGDGIYLLALELYSNDPLLDDPSETSNPFYIVFGAGDHDEEEHEEAVHWVEENLLGLDHHHDDHSPIVPEPTTAALGLLGAAALLGRRRRG